MGRIFFKPMPWLSVVTAICTAILITLGIWQYQRLQWKTALLAEVELAVNAPPLTSLEQLRAAISEGEAVDFRKIDISAKSVSGAQNKFVFYPQQGGIFWRSFIPVYSDVKDAPKAIIYAITDVVEDKDRDSFSPKSVDGILGYVRFSHDLRAIEAKVKSKASPEKNRYFKFNQTGDWDKDLPAHDYFFDSYYIEHVASARNAQGLPTRRPKIRNNHFDYMLTWFSFAGVLWIIYAILHVKAGRLYVRDASVLGQDR
ncbi:MAG: SURF1 family cytochrome oxidase biogenesis protein [Litorimonas sp.]